MALSIITDPFFYMIAAPAVFLLGVSKSGFGAGFGSLAVPMMALAVTVPQAAAILMPVLLVMDLLGMAAFRKDVDRALLRFMLPYALLGVVLGALLFKLLDARWVAAIVGGFTLLFLAQQMLLKTDPNGPPPPRWLGGVLLIVSGFTSFIAHAGGPPVNAYVMRLKLSPVLFTGTMAYLFFFINMAKWAPYAWLGLLDMRNFGTSLVLLPLAPVGVWVGVRMARTINPVLFYRLIRIGMFLTGCKLLWDGVR
ncbi:COG0730 Predicted permeases [Burkholderiaceae bacterium]